MTTPLWQYVLGAWIGYLSIRRWKTLNYELTSIPTVGPSGFFTSWKNAIEFVWDSPGVLQRGYDLYPGVAFKIWTFSGWLVMISGRDMVEDVRKASDDELSFFHIVEEQLQTKYTMGMRGTENIYHVDVVRTTLTKNVGACFDRMYDEVVACFKDFIPCTEEWTAIPALETSMQMVSRANNRMMIGLPVCRDPEYIQLNIHFTVQVFKAAVIINLFPEFLQPIVGRCLSETRRSLEKGRRLLGPMIQERLDKENQFGRNWPDRPNDLISWLIDHEGAQGAVERTVDDITMRILTINIAAEHTSSMTFTHALFDLATNPQLIQPLREEMEAVIRAEGWTKKAMGALYRLDSFMKESQRHYGLSSLALSRKALVPFRFSNGITIPVGTNIGTPVIAVHHDEQNYPDAHEFRPFRFSELREKQEDKRLLGEHMVTPKPEYLPFGAGKHACPGRFLAANAIKLMITYTLMHYDIKLEGDSKERPKNFWVGNHMTPATKAKVLFRKRADP